MAKKIVRMPNFGKSRRKFSWLTLIILAVGGYFIFKNWSKIWDKVKGMLPGKKSGSDASKSESKAPINNPG